MMKPKYAISLSVLCFSGLVGYVQADENVLGHTCAWLENEKGVVSVQPVGCFPLGEPKAAYSSEVRLEIASPLPCNKSQTDEGKILNGSWEAATGKIYSVTRVCRSAQG
jgi:hypothetical protein